DVKRAVSIEDLRERARKRLPRSVFDFYDGGAEDELTLRDNRAAFERIRLRPRVLRDVATVDTATTVLGKPVAMPLLVAPTGAVGFGWPHGEVALALAAQQAGVPFILSSSATSSIERVAQAVPGHRLWFQAYVFKDPGFTLQLIERARVAGYEALMITVDLTVGGKRERDMRNQLSVPFRFTPRNLAGFARKPVWALAQLLAGRPVLENLVGLEPPRTSTGNLVSSVGNRYDASFDFDALARIRDAWGGKLIVKGVVRDDDTERLVRLGCDAIVVSNHGGRQLDAGIATMDALPEVLAAAAGRIEVMVDSGVRRGVDIIKALALGATAVLAGRATLYGVCAAGLPGACRALEILADELKRSMQLCGVRRVAEITSDLVVRGEPERR
ncbi:MAG: alpha-hydroxy acid oxidase, partial [Quisquiliibacterium sp.]